MKILETIAGEEGNVGDCAKGAEEGGDEQKAAVFVFFREPAGGAAADGLAGEDDLRRGDFLVFDEELIGA